MAANGGEKRRVGDIVAGKYRIEKILGRGGMGMVVAARHLALRELRAVKFMRARVLENASAVERFQREAEAASRLRSVHAVKIYDIDRTEDGELFIVMEHLQGKDLNGLLKERESGCISAQEAAHYVRQACAALAEAHAAGIVHRDLKLGNLFVTRGPRGEPCVKVLDFGLAKLKAPEDAERPQITMTRMILGSPAFMSPEQIRDARSVDARTDIWALGVILYKLTTGVLPFDAASMNEIFTKILSKPARPPSKHVAELPPFVDEIVSQCLEKNVERRYQSVEALSAALLSLDQVDQDAKTMVLLPRPLTATEVDSNDMTPDITTQVRHKKQLPVADPRDVVVADSNDTTAPKVRMYAPDEIVAIEADPNLSVQTFAREAAAALPNIVDDSNETPAFTGLHIQPAHKKSLLAERRPTPKHAVEVRAAEEGTAEEGTADFGRRVRGFGWIRRRAPLSIRAVIAISVFVGTVLGALVFWIALQMQATPGAAAPFAPSPSSPRAAEPAP